jgi:hypothetical protein
MTVTMAGGIAFPENLFQKTIPNYFLKHVEQAQSFLG